MLFPRSSQAFTLLEVLIVLSLMSILLALSVHNLRALLIRTQIHSLTHQLQALILYARAEALATHENVRLCPSSNGSECQKNLQHRWQASLILLQGNHVLPVKLNWPATISLYWFAGLEQVADLRFDQYGRVGVQQGHFILCPQAPYSFLAKVLVVLHSGRLRLSNDYSKLAAHCFG